MSYFWRPGADWGGGYSMMILADPSTPGQAFAGLDYGGIFTTTNSGSLWQGAMGGCTIKSGGGVDNQFYSRAAAWSVKTPGKCYVGCAPPQNASPGNGFFGWVQNGARTLTASSNYGFGTTLPTGFASHRPRAGGRIIQVDFDSSSGTEYVYACMTKSGANAVVARTTDGNTFTDLLAETIRTDNAWKTACLVASDVLLVGSYRDITTDQTTQTGSTVWKITTGGGGKTIRNATAQSDLTITTPTVPGVVEDIRKIGSNVYAACGPYGVYSVTSSGTTWTKLVGGVGSFFAGKWVSSIDGDGTNLYVGCSRGVSGSSPPATTGANIIAKSTDGGSTWTWVSSATVTHGTTGTTNSVPWGSPGGAEWWLLKQGAPAFDLYPGGASMDIQQISVGASGFIYATGSAGAWLSKDGGASWRPANIGLNGGQVTLVTPSGAGSAKANNTDYTDCSSTDHMSTGTRLGTAVTGTANTALAQQTDGSGNTYTLTIGNPPDCKRNGVSIADAFMRSTLHSVTDFKVSSDGYVYLTQNGGGVIVGDPSGGTIVDTQPPTAPTTVAATSGGASSVTVTWSGATDNVAVTGYQLFRGGVLVASPTTSPYTDTGLAASTSYTYTVKALDAAGNISPASASASATTTSGGGITPPTAPTSVSAVAVSSTSIAATWSGATPGSDVLSTGLTRSGLLALREGYGANATGGLLGPEVIVTTLADDAAVAHNTAGDMSLRGALAVSGAKWITFAPGLSAPARSTWPAPYNSAPLSAWRSDAIWIESGNNMNVPTNTTIDGRGANLYRLQGRGFQATGPNVIVHNMTVDFSQWWAANKSQGSAGLYNIWDADMQYSLGPQPIQRAGQAYGSLSDQIKLPGNWKGTWDPAVTYSPGDGAGYTSSSNTPPDGIVYNGVGYKCIQAGTGHQPDVSPTFWTAAIGGSVNGAGYLSIQENVVSGSDVGWSDFFFDHNTFIGPAVGDGSPARNQTTLWDFNDGGYSICFQHHNATYSWNSFVDMNKSSIIGCNTTDSTGFISEHHNHFQRGIQRQPLARRSQVHVYANWYDQPGLPDGSGQTIAGDNDVELLYEGNLAESALPQTNALAFKRGGTNTHIVGKTHGNTVLGNMTLANDVGSLSFTIPYSYALPDLSTSGAQQAFRNLITAGAGAQINSAAPAGVFGYKVYRDGTIIATTSVTSYTDTGLAQQTSYTYTVKAFDAFGDVSAFSPGASAQTLAIRTLIATLGGAATSYTHTGLQPSTTYRYVLTASDAAGNVSADSNQASATTPSQVDTQPPTAPGSLTATPTQTTIDLAWTQSTDNVAVTGYRVYRDGGLLASLAPTTTYSDVTGQPGILYFYHVTALDGAGNQSGDSNTASASYPVPPANGLAIRSQHTYDVAGATSVTFAPPTGTQPGDIVIAVLRATCPAQTLGTVQMPAGWTTRGGTSRAIVENLGWVAYNTNQLSYTWTWANAATGRLSVFAITGTDTVNVFDSGGTSGPSSSPFIVPHSSITLANGGDMMLLFGWSPQPVAGTAGPTLADVEAPSTVAAGLSIFTASLSGMSSGLVPQIQTNLTGPLNVGTFWDAEFLIAGTPVIVDTPPTLTVTSPVDGQTLTGTSVTVQAQTSDSDGIGEVDVSVNGGAFVPMNAVAVDAAGNGTYGLTVTLTTDAAPGAANTIDVQSTDAAPTNNATASAPTITVNAITPSSDSTGPTITWSQPPSGNDLTIQGATGFDFTITGIATDASGVNNLQITNPDATVSTISVDQNGNFSYDWNLATGTNAFTIVATDSSPAANTTSKSFTITLAAPDVTDTTGPTLAVSSPAANQTVHGNAGTQYNVAGTAVDPSGIASITVNSLAVAFDASSGDFSTTITLASGANVVTVVATDASAGSNTTTVTHTITLSAVVGPTLVVTAPPGDVVVTGDSPYLYQVTGTVTSSNGIGVVTVNGMAAPVASDGSWSILADLSPGPNTLTITATDTQAPVAGQTTIVRVVTLDTPQGGFGDAFNLSSDQARIAERIQERGLE